jgi:signal transduction histidine kinase
MSSAGDALKEAIACGETARIRAAAKAAHVSLHRGDVNDPLGLGLLLLPLAGHADAKIREAVANACAYLPPPMGDPELERLVDDGDPFVKNAARSAIEKRDALEAAARKSDELDVVSEEILAGREAGVSPAARRRVEQAIKKRMAYVFGQLFHQLANVNGPLDNAVGRIRDEASKPAPNLAAIRRDAKLVAERRALQWSVIVATRIYMSAATPRFREERLAAIVDEAAELVADVLATTGRRLELANEIDRSLTAHVDRELLSQAVQNVLKNGAESYGEREGAAPLRATARPSSGGSRVVISFEDEGAGMTDAQLATLFVPYRTNKPGGTGLGMLNVRKMVEEVHGGKLAVKSAPGRGTTISFTLRAKPAAAKTVAKTRTARGKTSKAAAVSHANGALHPTPQANTPALSHSGATEDET